MTTPAKPACFCSAAGCWGRATHTGLCGVHERLRCVRCRQRVAGKRGGVCKGCLYQKAPRDDEPPVPRILRQTGQPLWACLYCGVWECERPLRLCPGCQAWLAEASKTMPLEVAQEPVEDVEEEVA